MHRLFYTLLVFICCGSTSLYAQANLDCSDLFFSEYVEGSSNYKAIELFNPTADSVDLSQYWIRLYSNGSLEPTFAERVADTTMMLPSLGTYVIVNGRADDDLLTLADAYRSAVNFNGNDYFELAVVVSEGDTMLIDAIGQYGVDPGSDGWMAGDMAVGKDHTWRRRAEIAVGDRDSTDQFDAGEEWEIFDRNDFSGLGMHSSDGCPTWVESLKTGDMFRLYPNPISGKVIRWTGEARVSGLNLISVTGQTYTAQVSAQDPQATLPDVAPGLYLVEFQFPDGQTLTQKLILR